MDGEQVDERAGYSLPPADGALPDRGAVETSDVAPWSGNWIPTPAEIAAECLAIQATWTRQERWLRAPHLAPVEWTVPRLADTRGGA